MALCNPQRATAAGVYVSAARSQIPMHENFAMAGGRYDSSFLCSGAHCIRLWASFSDPILPRDKIENSFSEVFVYL